MKMKICNVLWAVLGVLVSCFASPALFACNQPTNLGHAFPAWAPNAIIQINLGGTPSSPEQAAAAAWDNSILSYYDCGPFFIVSGTLTDKHDNHRHAGRNRFFARHDKRRLSIDHPNPNQFSDDSLGSHTRSGCA